MKRIMILAVAASLTTGCVSLNKKPMDASSAVSLKDKTVAKTSYKKPDFAAMTAGKAAFAVLGAAAMISAGNEIVAKNNINDPAEAIASELAKTVEDKYSAHVSPASIAASSNDVNDIVAQNNGAADFAIDVQTVNWSFGYFPTDWSHYRVIYVAKARLIDTHNKSILAEGFCRHVPESNTNAPTYDELLANDAERLKKELGTAADECVKSLKTEMLVS